MASPVSKSDLKRYFVSAEAYAPLRQKAKFALRAAKFEARSEEELSILRALTEVSEDEALFLQSLKTQITPFDSDKVNAYVTKLIEGTRSKSPEKREPVVARKKPTLKIAIPDTDVVVSSNLQRVSPSMQEKKAKIVAARLISSSVFPIEVLQNERAFVSFAEHVKLALQMGIDDSTEKKLARQVVGVLSLLESMPFDQALERALGKKVLAKVITDLDLEFFQRWKAGCTRQSMLEYYVDKWMKIEWPNQKVPRPSLPEEWTLQRSNSATEEKVFEIARPMLHARSHTVIGLNDDSIYPEMLRDRHECRKMVQGAVVMKHLFIAGYEKNFPSSKMKKIVDRLIQFHLQMKYSSKKSNVLMEECFRELIRSDRNLVIKVFDQLLKDQTVGKLHTPPRTPSASGLPEVLTQPPFHQAQTATDFIALLAKTKFDFELMFKKTYSKKEKRLIDFLLDVSLLMDFMTYDFKTAVLYLLPVYGKIQAKALERLIALTDPLNLEPKSVVEKGSIDQVLNSIPFFQDGTLFGFAVEYVQAQLPRLADIKMVKLAEMLIQISSRIQRDPISLQEALKKTFNAKGLQRLLNCEDEGKNIKVFRTSIENLLPKLYVKSKAFQSEQGLLDLIERAKVCKSGDPVCLKMIGKLLEAEQLLKKMRWDLVICWQFNHESLRVLFDETNDHKNSEAVQKAFNQIIG